MKNRFILGLASCGNKNEAKVSAENFGNEWPLIVDSGILSCEPGSLIVLEVNAKKYAVNGAAGNLYPSILTISKDNKEFGSNLKMSSSTLIEKGLKLCN